MANSKKSPSKFRVDEEAKAELTKNLDSIENDVIKEAGQDVLGGTAYSQAHVSGGWLRGSSAISD